MGTRVFGRRVVGAALGVLILAGCGGTQTSVPQGGSPQGGVHQASGSSGDLVYAITAKGIVVLSYPTWSIVAKIPSYRTWYDVCSDPNNGNVFAVAAATSKGEIDEYAHGGTTPIATITPPPGYGGLGACSVDPTTGNLAVVAISTPKEFHDAVLVYPQAQGNPTIYSDKQLPALTSPAYDDTGDLFVSAVNKAEGSRLGELKVGRNQFTVIQFGSRNTYLQQIQWDGTYLTFLVPNGRGYGATVNRIKVSGRTGTIERSVLIDHCQNAYFSIYDGALLSFYYPPRVNDNYAIASWDYRFGGKPTSKFYGVARGRPDYTYDLAVSVGSSRAH